MEKIWRIKNSKADEASKELRDFLRNDVLSHLLSLRGIKTPEEARLFLNPKEGKNLAPNCFCDMERAVERIKQAIENNEHILIWGDFDADGVSATAILYKTFEHLGANFSHFIPNRETHGHGLNSKELIKMMPKKKLKLVITVDCGISDNAIIAMLKGFKIDTIITDHHKAPEILPEAFAILNPSAPNAIREDCTASQIKDLCNLAGAGVAYKLAEALLGTDTPLLNELLEIAAVGTIGDLVPLIGYNRTLVAQGLEALNKSMNKGIKKLFEGLDLKGPFSARDVAFILVPRINAAGRLSGPDEAFELLVETSDVTLNTTIQKLGHYNTIRQSLCDEMFNECIKKIGTVGNAIILFDENWHVGLIGLAASRLVETFAKPVFLGTKSANGEIRFSVRGIEPYNIYEILKENENLFLGYGGHRLAGGFSFNPEENSLEVVQDAILKTIDEMATIFRDELEFGRALDVDFETEHALSEELVRTFELLEPCGQENEQPVFCIQNVKLLDFKQVGKEGSHLKFECEKNGENLSCIWWRKSNFNAQNGDKLDIAFYPKLNVFNGATTVQLEIIDLKGETSPEIHKAAETVEIKIYDHRNKNLSEILEKIDGYVAKNSKIKVLASRLETLESIGQFQNLKTATQCENYDEVMFFNYPISEDELQQCIAGASKIHLMPEQVEPDPKYYFESLYKMLKYAHNKKNGEISPQKMAQLLGVSEIWIRSAIGFLESSAVLELITPDKIKLADTIPNWESCLTQELLLEELSTFFEFKRFLSEVETGYFQGF